MKDKKETAKEIKEAKNEKKVSDKKYGGTEI